MEKEKKKILGSGVAVASKRFQRPRQAVRNRSIKKKEEKEEVQKGRETTIGYVFFVKVHLANGLFFPRLIELKRKWEEGKERLKASRRFKSY